MLEDGTASALSEFLEKSVAASISHIGSLHDEDTALRCHVRGKYLLLGSASGYEHTETALEKANQGL